MSEFLKMLTAQFDLWNHRYKAFFVKTEEERAACIEILHAVRKKELNRVRGSSVLDSSAFSNHSLSYRLVGVEDTKRNRIVGCIRMTPAIEAFNVPASRLEYHLDIFGDDLLSKLSILTRLAVLKEYRKTPAAVVLMAFCFVERINEGGKGMLMSCEPNLLPMYRKLGLRTLGHMHNSPTGGYRIPMICIPDLAHLKKVKSPGLPLLKAIDFSKHNDICEWLKNYLNNHADLEVGAALYSNDLDRSDGHLAVTKGLSKKGLKSFLKNAVELKCKAGDLLIEENDGGKAFGYVHKGQVNVLLDEGINVPLPAGSIFGEIAFVLDIKRSAKVEAASDDTVVVMFSVSALNRLESNSDKSVIWRNLASVLATKLIATNGMLN